MCLQQGLIYSWPTDKVVSAMRNVRRCGFVGGQGVDMPMLQAQVATRPARHTAAAAAVRQCAVPHPAGRRRHHCQTQGSGLNHLKGYNLRLAVELGIAKLEIFPIFARNFSIFSSIFTFF